MNHAIYASYALENEAYVSKVLKVLSDQGLQVKRASQQPLSDGIQLYFCLSLNSNKKSCLADSVHLKQAYMMIRLQKTLPVFFLAVVQVGMSLQSQDLFQRNDVSLTLAIGLIISFAKEILDVYFRRSFFSRNVL